MIHSFFESVKYVGHLVPVAFLRVFLGWYYFQNALTQYQGDFLTQPRLAAQIGEWLPGSQAPFWFREFLENVVVPHWHVFAYILTFGSFLIGLSYLLGYAVRPVALLATVMALAYFWAAGPQTVEFYRVLIAVNFTMAWLGAGRCLGFDYFFFKRHRGIWW
jgi:thiosulfate dehydrogenase [quinone] large subunit